MKPLAPLLAAHCALACSAGAPPPDPVAASRAPRSSDPSVAAEVSRSAVLPPPRHRDERVVLARDGAIWMMGPDGSDPVQLSVRPLDGPDLDPALSPAGDAVAYASIVDGTYRIVVLPLADPIPRPLTDGGGVGDRQPAWSPDGRRIAFMRGDPRDRVDLLAVEVRSLAGADPREGDGSDDPALPAPTVLLRGDDTAPERVGGPAFSPDGAAIVLSADRRAGKGTGLWRLDLAGGALARITPVPRRAEGVVDLDPAFSPDGRRIAFASNRHLPAGHGEDLDLHAVDADGSGLTRLTDDPGTAREPAYSPDGQRLFFASTRDRRGRYEWEVYVMAASGGRPLRLGREERPQNRAPSAGLAK